ncbi:uncharacterized protein LOC135498339 [Lineus longissimus]|uniref:uncharacterized protein LOC135498339 n=1 Tax=Lineus longissimus TaxID=88925 RepID=UPI002B4F36FF
MDRLKFNEKASLLNNMASHKPVYIALIVVSWLFYIGAIIAGTSTRFIYDAASAKNETKNVTYDDTLINPAPWTFGVVWSIIFLYQGIWIIYVTASIFRRGKITKSYVYTMEGICPPLTYVFFILGCAGAIVWSVVFVYEILLPNLFPLLFAWFSLYAALIICYRDSENHFLNVVKDGLLVDVVLVRAFIHNGLATFATWVTLAFFVQLSVVLKYVTMADELVSSIVILAVILVLLIVWFAFNNFIFPKFCQFTFTPYFVVLLATAGIISDGFDTSNAALLFALVILIVDIVLLIVTIVLVVRRFKSKSLAGLAVPSI